MKKKLTILLALVLALSLFAVACKKDDAPAKEGTKAADSEKTTEAAKDTEKEAATEGGEKATEAPVTGEAVHVEVLAKGFQHQFWKAVEQGANEAAAKYGATINFVGPPSEEDIQVQVQQFKDAIAKKPAAICLAALDTSSVLEQLETSKSENIPVIGFDSGVPDAPAGTIAATASTDNEAAGAIAAEEVYKIIKSKLDGATKDAKVRIGVVSQEANSASIVGRTNGFINKMRELIGKDKTAVIGHEKFKDGDEAAAAVIIEVGVPAKIDDAAGQATATAIMEKEDVVAMFGSNEFGANSLVRANESLGGKMGKFEDGKIVGAGFDAGSFQKDAVKEGILTGSVTQDPVQIGFQAVEMAIKAAKGEAVADSDTGARWYTAANMGEDVFGPLLYD